MGLHLEVLLEWIIGKIQGKTCHQREHSNLWYRLSQDFALMTKMNTIRILLSLVAIKVWSLHQFDVKNAFLHKDLEKEFHMDIPLGYKERRQKNKMYRLKKSLYRLKQSPQAWFGRVTKSILNRGYSQSQEDHTLFIKLSSIRRVTLLIMYVDDIIVTSDDNEEMLGLKVYLTKEFEIKDLRSLRYFLGIEVARFSTRNFYLSIEIHSRFPSRNRYG